MSTTTTTEPQTGQHTTSRGKWSQEQVEDSGEQLLLYSHLASEISPGKKIATWFLVLTKTKARKWGRERLLLRGIQRQGLKVAPVRRNLFFTTSLGRLHALEVTGFNPVLPTCSRSGPVLVTGVIPHEPARTPVVAAGSGVSCGSVPEPSGTCCSAICAVGALQYALHFRPAPLTAPRIMATASLHRSEDRSRPRRS
jgi:hypothetical protein